MSVMQQIQQNEGDVAGKLTLAIQFGACYESGIAARRFSSSALTKVS